jgi:hypothetical protein
VHRITERFRAVYVQVVAQQFHCMSVVACASVVYCCGTQQLPQTKAWQHHELRLSQLSCALLCVLCVLCCPCGCTAAYGTEKAGHPPQTNMQVLQEVHTELAVWGVRQVSCKHATLTLQQGCLCSRPPHSMLHGVVLPIHTPVLSTHAWFKHPVHQLCPHFNSALLGCALPDAVI